MFNKLKYFFQRLFRGYSDDELWSLDDTIAKFALPRLKAFKKNTISFPGNGINEEEWDIILGKMIFAFDHMLDDSYIFTLPYSMQREVEERIDEGLKLFGIHFRSLWD